MLDPNNVVFNSMLRQVRRFEQNRRKRNEDRDNIITLYGADSQEMEQWYKEVSQSMYPLSPGSSKALIAWTDSIAQNTEELELSAPLFNTEASDFIRTLRHADISTFIYTNQSAYTMKNIHALINAGCKLLGLFQTKRRKHKTNETETILGIRFEIISTY